MNAPPTLDPDCFADERTPATGYDDVRDPPIYGDFILAALEDRPHGAEPLDCAPDRDFAAGDWDVRDWS